MLCAACRHHVTSDAVQCPHCHRVLTLSGAVVEAPIEPEATEPSSSSTPSPPTARPPCAVAGCGRPVARGRTLCLAHQAERQAERRRGFALLSREGWEIAVEDGSAVLLGRDPSRSPAADRFLACPFISGRHATVSARAGLLYIVDHASTNGTRVNGARLSPEVEHVLVSGDVVTLGGEVPLVVR